MRQGESDTLLLHSWVRIENYRGTGVSNRSSIGLIIDLVDECHKASYKSWNRQVVSEWSPVSIVLNWGEESSTKENTLSRNLVYIKLRFLSSFKYLIILGYNFTPNVLAGYA